LNARYGARRHVDFGTLVASMFANLSLVWRPLAVYVAVVAVLALVLPLAGEGVRGIPAFALYLAGQYWLFRTLLKARGLLNTQRIHGFAFLGLAAMLILPIMFGLGLLVLPGLFLTARWIAAPAFVVAQGDNPIAAASASWNAVRGHTVQVVGIIALSVIGASTIGAILRVLIGDLGGTLEPIEVIQLQFIPLLLFGLSTASYELLGPEDNSIEEVFG
jgi:hypothetical protein